MNSLILSKTFFPPFVMQFLSSCASHSPGGVRSLSRTASVRLQIQSPLWVGKPEPGLLMDHLGNPTRQVITDPCPTKTLLMWALDLVSDSLAKAWEGSDIRSHWCQGQMAWPLPDLWSWTSHSHGTPRWPQRAVFQQTPRHPRFPPHPRLAGIFTHPQSRIPASVLLGTWLAVPLSFSKCLCVWGWMGQRGPRGTGFGTILMTLTG